MVSSQSPGRSKLATVKKQQCSKFSSVRVGAQEATQPIACCRNLEFWHVRTSFPWFQVPASHA